MLDYKSGAMDSLSKIPCTFFFLRYGWHFPEMGKIITDNLAYVRTVQEMGMRENAKNTDLSDILPEDIEEKVKEAAEISMGTEISDHDMINIRHLCHQVTCMSDFIF
jgi:nucleolar protein 58